MSLMLYEKKSPGRVMTPESHSGLQTFYVGTLESVPQIIRKPKEMTVVPVVCGALSQVSTSTVIVSLPV